MQEDSGADSTVISSKHGLGLVILRKMVKWDFPKGTCPSRVSSEVSLIGRAKKAKMLKYIIR